MSCCNNNSPISNIVDTAIKQDRPFSWFRDGVKGLIKCFGKQQAYSDEDIQKNREVCKNCEHSTKSNGKITVTSQCMANDPATGAPCGCFITCKTQVDICPLGKWSTTPIAPTIHGQPVKFSKDGSEVEL